MDQHGTTFVNEIKKAITESAFVKLALGNYKGTEEGLKQLYVKPVLIKNKQLLAFNYRYKTRDIFKNFEIEEGLSLIEGYLAGDFNVATLFSTHKEMILERSAKGSFRLRTKQLEEKRKPTFLIIKKRSD